MSEENQNTESSAAGNNQTANASSQAAQKEGLAAILGIINQPAVAAALATAAQYFLTNPKGQKATLDRIEEIVEWLADAVKDQRKEIKELKRRITRLTQRSVDDDEGQEDNLRGYRKAGKQHKSAYLD